MKKSNLAVFGFFVLPLFLTHLAPGMLRKAIRKGVKQQAQYPASRIAVLLVLFVVGAFVFHVVLSVPGNLVSPSAYAQVAQQPHGPTLSGWVDLHTHPVSDLGFGGKLLYGGEDIGAKLSGNPNCSNPFSNGPTIAANEQQALGNDNPWHGGPGVNSPINIGSSGISLSAPGVSNPCGDALRALFLPALEQGTGGVADEMDGGSGFPNFQRWPIWNDVTHQKMWVEWIRRAFLGGLRVMVALAVNSKTIGDLTRGPGDLPDDDKTSADIQIAEIEAFVKRHPDFMQLAFSANDVFQIVSANKLAVLVGVEVDHIGNFSPQAMPTDADAIAEIDRLYGEGVRYIFPIHLIDSAFGGTAAFKSLFDVSNARENGLAYFLKCDNPANYHAPANPARDLVLPLPDQPNANQPTGFTYSNNALDITAIAGQLLKLGIAYTSIGYPSCPPGVGQINTLGLTPVGVTAIKRMMQHGMLIDIDHMSQASADQTLALATQFGYPVNSGHNGVRGAALSNHNERALRADQYATIGRLHGMAGVGSAGLDAQQWLTLYNTVVQAMGGGSVAAGFGTDTNGLELGMPPRAGAAGKPSFIGAGPQHSQYEKCITTPPCLPSTTIVNKGQVTTIPVPTCNAKCRAQFPQAFQTYPATPASFQYNPTSFPQSQEGSRRFDYLREGVVHYGMLWDFIQDVRTLPGGANTVDNSLMNGADYFVVTWRIAEARSTTVK